MTRMLLPSLALSFAIACSSDGQVQPVDTDETGTVDTDPGTTPDPLDVDGDGDGVTPRDGDCDDTDPARFPGNPETCNGIDDDCDQVVDTDADISEMTVWGADVDQDGYGSVTDSVIACDPPAEGMVVGNGDCDDTNAEVNPDAKEVCDSGDNDCNEVVDDVVFDHEIDFCGGATECHAVAGTVETTVNVFVDGVGFLTNGQSYHALIPVGTALTVYRQEEDRLHTCTGSEYATCTDQWCLDAAQNSGWFDVQLHFQVAAQ